MTATLNLSEKELLELTTLTKQSDASAALRLALQEYIRYAKRMRLKELSEQVEMQDNWQEIERLEMESQHGRPCAD